VITIARKFESRLELHVGSIRHILAAAFQVRVREVVNGEYYVQFIYPREDDDAERYTALLEGHDIQFPQNVERGQRFRIRRVEEVREGRKVYKVVEAHHIAFTLNNYYLDDYIDFAAAKTLSEMLTMLGNDTPFTFAIEGSFDAQDIFDWGEKKRYDLLQELRQLYGAEIAHDNYAITLTTRKGGNYGARVRYAHNMKGIRRTSHDMERITRLYGYGKNGLTIEGYGGRTVKYIDSPYLDPSNPFMGSMEWPDIDDQGRLLQEMEKYLAKYEFPNVSYATDFIQMEKVDADFESERIREAGDTVTVLDTDLGYSFDARAIEYERYPFEPKRGSAILANFRPMKTSDYIFQATVASKKAMVYTSENAVLKGVKYDDSLTLVDGLGMKVTDDLARERLRIGQTGPGEYGLTMYNKAGDKTVWQDATTGDARFKGLIQASAFEGGTIAIGSGNNIFKAGPDGIQLGHANFASAPFRVSPNGHMVAVGAEFSGTITASILSGGQINGTTITGSLIQTAQAGVYPRSEMSVSQAYFAAYAAANKYIMMSPYFFQGSGVVLSFNDGAYDTALYQDGSLFVIGGVDTRVLGDLSIQGSGELWVPTWGQIVAGSTSLSTELGGKATYGADTTPAGGHNHGISPGRYIMTYDAAGNELGLQLWVAAAAHVHNQT
jgi:phage minor structural protein, N-terminal region